MKGSPARVLRPNFLSMQGLRMDAAPAISARSAALPSGELGIDGWGYVRSSIDEIAPYRKSLPAWASEEAGPTFLKYADDQTVMAVRAIDSAFAAGFVTLEEQRDWSVVVASQFLGRQACAVLLHRFQKNGATGVSPHIIAHHSLHSVSGALSILLGTRGLNVGVGGGPHALSEGLLAAQDFFALDQSPGTWLVTTGWDPEPILNSAGECVNEPVCHAVAIALRPRVAHASKPRLTMGRATHESLHIGPIQPGIRELVDLLEQCNDPIADHRLSWNLPSGDLLALEVAAPSFAFARAA